MIRLCAFCLTLLLVPVAGLASVLEIINDSGQPILNIMAQKGNEEVFLRLDLLPGARGEVENPGCVAPLRVDTGLQLWRYPAINLAKAKKLVFMREEPAALQVDSTDGKSARLLGTITELLPGRGARPVCNLENFHPAMPMSEVCGILPADLPRDDNGALLTGMGFGGMVWAARLAPVLDSPVGADPLLEHMELRRPLDKKDIAAVVDALFAEGYVPWQAELPGLDLEFGANANAAEQKKLVVRALEGFLDAWQPQGHVHAPAGKCAEASLIMAPAASLKELENADNPSKDARIFTIILRPCAKMLLLDVAAYRAEGA